MSQITVLRRPEGHSFSDLEKSRIAQEFSIGVTELPNGAIYLRGTPTSEVQMRKLLRGDDFTYDVVPETMLAAVC